jgi:hypothetical protein
MSKRGMVTDSDKYDGNKSNSKNIIKYNILILLNLLGLLGLSEEFPAIFVWIPN